MKDNADQKELRNHLKRFWPVGVFIVEQKFDINFVRSDSKDLTNEDNKCYKDCRLGSSCGSVGKAVASDTKRSAVRIHSSAKIYKFIEHFFAVSCVLKGRK